MDVLRLLRIGGGREGRLWDIDTSGVSDDKLVCL